MNRSFGMCAWVLGVIAAGQAVGATITASSVTDALGPDFFFDTAATGGNDNNSNPLIRDITGYWGVNATVTLRGLGWASSASGTTAAKVTVTFTDLGPDQAFGTGDDIQVGEVTDALEFTGASEYVWRFDSPIVFTAAGNGLRMSMQGLSPTDQPATVRRKTTSGSSAAAVKLSLAGTAVGGDPPPTSDTATSSGFWDTIEWDTGSGTVTGGLPAVDTAVVGGRHQVSFRGLPAGETIAALHLGHQGDGYLELTAGDLTVSGDVVAGLGDSVNDGFLRIHGGALQVNGDVHLGRFVEGGDGTLEIGGGSATIAGDLNMGAYLQGGSLVRFHNPGAAPAIQVEGAIRLHRASLALTFDDTYAHVPGATIDLVEYGAREGQFLNFREGEAFNAGPNRFRVNVDVDAGGGRSKIMLTALPNWARSVGPNIILLFADDQGSADLRLRGDPRYPMPRLESLAASGATFSDAYVSGGVCHPSRCGLLVGRHQQRFGTDNNLSGPSYNGMAVSEHTVPRRLQGLGYRTYGIGKWHLGTTVEFHPLQRGFDRWYGINAGSRSYWNASGEDQTFEADDIPQPQDEGDYVTDRIGRACVDAITEHLARYGTDQPFFIYTSFTAVHGPVDIDTPPAPRPEDPRYARLRDEFGLVLDSYGPPEVVFGGSTAATTQKNRYDLAAMTLALDENIGAIVDKLHAAGLSDDTLIVYLNDNGGAGWSSGYGGNFSYNLPLRGYKGGSMTEGSIRVPAVAAWPGVIPGGQTNTTPVTSLDFMATFVNADGGAPAAARNGLEGLDLLPLLRSGTPLPADRVLCWRAGDIDSGGSAARMGRWKIHRDNGSGGFSLYDLANDIHEDTNVAAGNPEVVAELVERFNAWNASNIEPLYGGSDMVVDAGLERAGISGGYRVNNRASTPAYLSASLRTPLPTTSDFSLGVCFRPGETNEPAGAQLWFVLGDSAIRADFIRAGVDVGGGTVRLEEGKTGTVDQAPLSAWSGEWTTGTLTYDAGTRELTFALGGTEVKVSLPGTYSTLDVYGCGAASMEGDVTQPFVLTPGGSDHALTAVAGKENAISMGARFTGNAVFPPVLDRARFASGPYALDPDALIESLGGGLYRVTTPTDQGETVAFFRMGFNRP